MAATTRMLRDLVGADRATIPEVLEARAHRSADAPFVIHESGHWTYAEARTEIGRFAGWLDARGFSGPGLRVASYLSKRPEALWTWFGTLVGGGVHVALHRAHKGAVLADMMARSGASLLVTESAALAELPSPRKHGFRAVLLVDEASEEPDWNGVVLHTWQDVTAAAPSPPATRHPRDPAALLFTSGTTGRSKGVLLPHNMFCRGAAHLADGFGFEAGDVFHDWLPLSHIGGQLHMTMSAVLAGACLAQFPTFSRSRFWEQVRSSQSTVFAGFTNVLKMILMAPERVEDRENPLRIGLIGYVPPEIHKRFEARFGVRLMDTYGMSEAEPLTVPDCDQPAPPGSCGRPSPDFEISILDEEDREVPPGQTGRICVRPRFPDVMMMGYEGDESDTVVSWRNLWFHTNDLGRMDPEGYLYFVDRMKHTIRRGGENISSLEVEQSILAHAAVADCAVVGVPDPLVGEEIKAVVTLRDGAVLKPEALHDHCAGAMARFMVPRYIDIRAALPYTDVGKIRRDALIENRDGTWDATQRRRP